MPGTIVTAKTVVLPRSAIRGRRAVGPRRVRQGPAGTRAPAAHGRRRDMSSIAPTERSAGASRGSVRQKAIIHRGVRRRDVTVALGPCPRAMRVPAPETSTDDEPGATADPVLLDRTDDPRRHAGAVLLRTSSRQGGAWPYRPLPRPPSNANSTATALGDRPPSRPGCRAIRRSQELFCKAGPRTDRPGGARLAATPASAYSRCFENRKIDWRDPSCLDDVLPGSAEPSTFSTRATAPSQEPPAPSTGESRKPPLFPLGLGV